ncbi:MAG: VWA domain-containing protein [Acidobacteria bacterium]|nr:VWA domain-containing protein [Acidobacteriota bacterium]
MPFTTTSHCVRRCAAVALLAALAGAFWLSAQAPASPPDLPAAVLRITTRLVLVDVVVTDKKGQPVTDLRKEDFTLLDNDQARPIAFFSLEQPAVRMAQRPAPPPLPEHVYTNRPEYRMPPGPLTVLLLDALNTPQQDQAYARDQMLRYLHTQLRPQDRMAILALTSQLFVLQDFTSDPALLQAALEKFNPERSVHLTRDEPLVNPEALAKIADLDTNIAAGIQRFEEEQAAVATDARVDLTLAALEAIGRATAGYPGRKNLIWVSGSFPFNLYPENAENFADFRSYSEDVRRIGSLLSDAQVAVYPVDARGLVGYSMASASEGFRTNEGRALRGPTFHEELGRRDSRLIATHHTMRQVAEDTGGRAFINRNDIDAAVGLSIADGSTYYTLGFYPEQKEWDGRFHRLQVKLARKGLAVRHRRGYYALDPARTIQPDADERERELLAQAKERELNEILFNPLPATLVTFRAFVPPPVGQRVTVEFSVDAHTLRFLEVDGRHECDVDFLVAAVAPEGRVVNTLNQTVGARLRPETYAEVRRDGLPYRLVFDLLPGRYQLRLVVRDNRSGLAGSATVPVVVE